MFLLKEGLSLIISRLFFNSNRNFLFSLVRTLNFSKDGEWLQTNKSSIKASSMKLEESSILYCFTLAYIYIYIIYYIYYIYFIYYILYILYVIYILYSIFSLSLSLYIYIYICTHINIYVYIFNETKWIKKRKSQQCHPNLCPTLPPSLNP